MAVVILQNVRGVNAKLTLVVVVYRFVCLNLFYCFYTCIII